MATARREQADSLIDLLATEPYRFDSRQVVRILEANQRLHKARAPRFRSSLSMAFPIADVESVWIPKSPRRAPVVTVSYLGLGGAMGPLPTPYSEHLAAGVRSGQTAGRDFLDFFNDRLIRSSIDLARLFRPVLQPVLPQQSDLARRLYAVLGLATPGLVEENPGFAASLLPLAGLLNQQPLSAHAIERAVSSYFGVKARVIPFRGGWMRLPAEHRTILGRAGRNNRLGETTMLGGKVWDQSANITLEIGPISLDRAEGFLPPGQANAPLLLKSRRRKKASLRGVPQIASPLSHRRMAQLLSFLVSDTVGVEIRLQVEKPTLRPSLLGRRQPPLRLGLTSWLNRNVPAEGDHATIILRPAVAIPRAHRER